MGRCRGDGRTRIGEHLVALELLDLHGHLGIAVLARSFCFELGYDLLVMGALLLALLGFCCRLALLGHALFLGFDLVEKRSKIGLGGRSRNGRSLLGCGLGFGLARDGLLGASAIAQCLFDSLFLGNVLRDCSGTCTRLGFGCLALHALALAYYLALEVCERVCLDDPARRLAIVLLLEFLLGLAFRSLRLTACALLLDRLASRALLFGLALLGLGLFLRERTLGGFLLGFGRYRLAESLADLVDVRLSQHAGVAFRRNLELAKLVEHFLAREPVFLCKLVDAHARHSLSYRPSSSANALPSSSAITAASSELTETLRAAWSFLAFSAAFMQSTLHT